MDFLTDYVSHDIDVHLTSDRSEAILTFHTAEGLIGVTCPVQVLQALQHRITDRLAHRVPDAPPH
jgi:hypothetical protein